MSKSHFVILALAKVPHTLGLPQSFSIMIIYHTYFKISQLILIEAKRSFRAFKWSELLH